MMTECSFKAFLWFIGCLVQDLSAFTRTLFPLKPTPSTALFQIGDQYSDTLIPRSEG